VFLSDNSSYRAKVLAAEYLGTTQIVTLQSPNGELKARINARDTVSPGETVGLEFRSAMVTLFEQSTGRALRSVLNNEVLTNG
jgi:multiple sugar transport system ATP-binding protein